MTGRVDDLRLGEAAVIAIPLLPCGALDDVVPFYEALGFEVTTRQERPNPYAATRWQGTELHYYGVRGDDRGRGGICLLIVPEVEQLHERFRQALQRRLGKVPERGIPRITRMRPGQTRFTVVDPAGNSVLYIVRGEQNPHHETRRMASSLSPLGKAMRNAEVLRDFKNDDAGAARVLRGALARFADADPDELASARATAMLTELDSD